MPSTSGMARSQIRRSIGLASPAFQPRSAAAPPSTDLGLVAEATHRGFEQAALHGVVVDDEDGGGHASPMPRLDAFGQVHHRS